MTPTLWAAFIALYALLLVWIWRRNRHESRARRILALLAVVLVALYASVGNWIARRWGLTAMEIGFFVTVLLASFLSPRERGNGLMMARLNRFFAGDEEDGLRHK